VTAPRDTTWPIEEHTLTKHKILERYLQGWLPVMAKTNGRIHFLDGFAGPGRYSGGEIGSPLIALQSLLKHPHFAKANNQRKVVFSFFEKEERRADALRAELKRVTLPNWVSCAVFDGEFAPLLSSILDKFEAEGNQLAPTFAFIDPFGFAGVPMDLIARIARNAKCECFINFMYEEINRFLSVPTVAEHYDALFGTPKWREIVDETDPDRRRDRIADLYRKQLETVAGFKYVREFQMVNRGNRTKYFLYFATKSEKGLSLMKAAMWKADPGGGATFSDRTNENQVVLFEPSPDLALLRSMLTERFRGKGLIQINQIERYVLTETPFSETMHLKKATLGPMEKNQPKLIEVHRLEGQVNRAGSYPPGTRIKFI
jgi:three-Cys-motif partner protein